MSRRSYQKVTLSVELTLPPGMKVKEAEALVKQAFERSSPFLAAQIVLKILRRETIYP